jgi:hypothetical protein
MPDKRANFEIEQQKLIATIRLQGRPAICVSRSNLVLREIARVTLRLSRHSRILTMGGSTRWSWL